MKSPNSPTGSVGRPRAFDTDAALEKAMCVFWRQGYEGTSLSDLTEAMGINRPSLYAAFGNKEELFRKVLERYGKGPANYAQEALGQASARQVIEHLWRGAAANAADPLYPRGCLAVQSALCCGEEGQGASDVARAMRMGAQDSLVERFKRAQREGDLPLSVQPEDLARYVATFLNGMSVQASNGATREELLRAVEIALRALPV